MKRVLVLLACTAVAHAETRPRYGGSVEGSLLGAPVTLDPPGAQTHAELTAVDLVFDTLYRVGPDGLVHPHLAIAAPAVDAARTTVRIALRKGVKFHDGSDLTAADVVASLERVRTTPARWALAAVTTIRIDGDGIELGLRVPVAELTTVLALPAMAITRAGKPPGERPIGSGPFVVDRFDRAKRVLILKAFDAHFAGRPYLDQLALHWYDAADGEARRFETGETHLSSRGGAAFTGAVPKYRADELEGPAALLVFAGFGTAHRDVTSDRSFRRALDLALARGAFTSVTSGERVLPAHEPVPAEAGGAPLSAAARTGDLEAARVALASAGNRVKALAADQLAQLKLEILVEDTRPDDREIAERVALALTKLGIGSTISAVPAATLRERVLRGTCDLWIGQLAAPVTSAQLWWGAVFAAGGDPWAELQLATASLDPVAAARTFADHLPIVPLVFRAVRIWHRSDVRGLAFDASGRPCYAELFLYGDPARSRGKP